MIIIFFRKKHIHGNTLEEKLKKEEIPFLVEEEEKGNMYSYMDAFGRTRFLILEKKEEKELILNGTSDMTQQEAVKLLKVRWELDQVLLKLQEEENYSDFFDVVEFLQKLRFRKKELEETWNVSNLASIQVTFSSKEADASTLLTGKKDGSLYVDMAASAVSAGFAAAAAFKKIYDKNPMSYLLKEIELDETSLFAEAIHRFLVGSATLKRLSELNEVETMLVDPGDTSSLLIQFENGSAMQWQPPLRLKEKGSSTILEVDPEHPIEENQEYHIVKKILGK